MVEPVEAPGAIAVPESEGTGGRCPSCGAPLDGGRWQRRGIGLCSHCGEPFYADGSGHERPATAADLAELPAAGLAVLRRDQEQLRRPLRRGGRRAR